MNNFSITKILLLFYMLVGNSLLQPLLSKQWIETVKNDRIIKHIIGVTTMLTIAMLISDDFSEDFDYFSVTIYSLIAYVWFIFLTKMDIHFSIIIIVLLLGNYMYDTHLKHENKKILNDNVLSEEIKNTLITRNNERSKYIMFSIMGLIVVSMFLYSNKKEGQYGGGYSLFNFLLY